jgi:hypothetical protein
MVKNNFQTEKKWQRNINILMTIPSGENKIHCEVEIDEITDEGKGKSVLTVKGLIKNQR